MMGFVAFLHGGFSSPKCGGDSGVNVAKVGYTGNVWVWMGAIILKRGVSLHGSSMTAMTVQREDNI